MPSIVYCLLVLFFTNILFEPTTCALPEYLQSIELDDITSLWDKFPSIIGQIKQAVNRFRCPKGWRRLGGSCYYLSNLTSTPFEANDTCNQLHSNHSNLMQIRNTVELFYAAHVLTKYNLSALMVELDSNLLKGKTMTDILLEDQGRWQRMKEKFREIRIRYYKIKDKVLRELESAGLRISQRSRKIKQTVRRRKQKYFDDQNEMYDDYDYIENAINRTNDTIEIDEYEYENLDEEDDDNEFERMDDISGICDQIDWNVLDSNTTVYMLTTFLIDDKIVCSISNVEQDLEYEHLCEYVLDFCFANVICGKHGRCVNTLSGFKCSCSFLYGGILCEKISRQGKQIIIGIVIILFFYSLSFKPIRWLLTMCVTGISDCFKLRKKRNQWKKAQKEKDDQQQLVNEKKKRKSHRTSTNDEQLSLKISWTLFFPNINHRLKIRINVISVVYFGSVVWLSSF